MHKQIREQTDKLTILLEEIDNLQNDQPIKMNKAEMRMVKTVAKIAKLTKALLNPTTRKTHHD